MAMPKAPAIFRARAKTDDATPISSCGTTEAMMLVRWDIPKPMPNAITQSGIIISMAVERGSRPVNK